MQSQAINTPICQEEISAGVTEGQGMLVDQLKLLGLTTAVLVVTACVVLGVNHVVRFRSGINTNESLRRLWSKPEHVIFHPVTFPLGLSWLIGLGVHTLVHSIMLGFLQLVDAVGPELDIPGEYALIVTGTISGSLAATIVYVVDGGKMLKQAQLPGMIVLFLAVGLPRVAIHKSPSVVALWTASILIATVFSSLWVAPRLSARVPAAQVRDLHSYSSQVNNFMVVLKVAAIMAVLLGLRGIEFGIHKYIASRGYSHHYLATLLRNCASLMVLVGCAFSGIWMTNFAVLKYGRDWQWVAASAPLGVLDMADLLLLLLSWDGQIFRVARMFRKYFMYTAASYLGAAAYLTVLARAASIALGLGAEGLSELIDEDEEYDIEV